MINQKLSKLLIMLSLIFAGSLSQLVAQETLAKSDQALVHAAIEDYVLGLYDAEPSRIERSVDTSLHKIGYYDYNGEAYYHAPMTYNQLFDLSASWNKDGQQANELSPKEIEIYQIYDRTASAKLVAKWGVDFMHLSKDQNGRWKIMNIMWQSEPK